MIPPGAFNHHGDLEVAIITTPRLPTDIRRATLVACLERRADEMLEKEVWTSRWTTYDKDTNTLVRHERRRFCWTVTTRGEAGIQVHCPLPEVEDWLFDGDADHHPSLGPEFVLGRRGPKGGPRRARQTAIQEG